MACPLINASLVVSSQNCAQAMWNKVDETWWKADITTYAQTTPDIWPPNVSIIISYRWNMLKEK